MPIGIAGSEKPLWQMNHAGTRGADGFLASIFSMLLLAICALLSRFEAAGILSLTVFFGYLAFVTASNPSFFFKYLPFIYAAVANLVGCTIVEYRSIFLPELYTTSEFAGSLPLLALSRWAFFAFLVNFDSRWGIERSDLSPLPVSSKASKWMEMCSLIVLALTLVSFIHVAAHPAFLLGTDRFAYAHGRLGGIWSAMRNALPYLMVFPALSLRRGNKRTGAVNIGTYILFLLWTGEKFGGFITLICVLCCVYYDRICTIAKKTLFKWIAVVLLVFATVIAGAVLLNSLYSSNANSNYFESRIAQQGQLWWRTYGLIESGAPHLDEFGREVDAFINPHEFIAQSVGATNGVYGIMYLSAPSWLVDRKLSGGSRYSEGGYAAAYYYGGAAGCLLFSLAMAVITFLIQNQLIKSIWTCRPVDVVIFTRFVIITRGAVSMFLFSEFIDPLSMLSILYLFMAALLRGRARRRPDASSARHSKKSMASPHELRASAEEDEETQLAPS